jgi:hypothetical protein
MTDRYAEVEDNIGNDWCLAELVIMTIEFIKPEWHR